MHSTAACGTTVPRAAPTKRQLKTSPTRIRTAVAGFRVLSANHYTIGELLGRLAQWYLGARNFSNQSIRLGRRKKKKNSDGSELIRFLITIRKLKFSKEKRK